ncbi:TPA: DNA-directed RNA polymerase subunit B [archaeon]|uniref:DNA-directed RNA polymerase subunit beta n=1 Tax=Candidatus Naiadarchaeum limnaeum TaxID=2756139 RepID=A0A832V0R1_9ARCH|nr:DNA-directed RNA polymerase subunit B [Candidatus Naiadarchaeum limnaeum]
MRIKEKIVQTGTKYETKRTDVYLNGRLIGSTETPGIVIEELKKMRLEGIISPEVSISYNKEYAQIDIWSDEGRIVRPLIRVENGNPLLTDEHIAKLKNKELSWDNLVSRGIIEYLDAAEEENAYVALKEGDLSQEHTHLELDASIIFGICAGLIPYLNHNMSTRVTLGANMSKQGCGLYVSNYGLRTDTQRHLLHYPQKPIARTYASDLIDFDNRPSGQNFVVAIISRGGYNMQDAIILNKAAIERGLGRSTFFRSYKAEERKYPGGQLDTIETPEKDVRGYLSEHSYRYLDEDGVISSECQVGEDDVLIGKTSPPRFLEVMEEFGMTVKNRRESSVIIRVGEGGVVDKVLISETLDGDKLVKVKVRDQRIPELGDKFASRHGQKGVIGIIVPQEDAPFTAQGITPDLIINPHAIPSRMTVGQLLETVGGKLGALEGRFIDGSPFSSEPEEKIRTALEQYGFKSSGKEVIYDGVTGEKLGAEIFIGVVYYQKLKHMVVDKIRARSRGPVQILTRQPTAGKSREGGLRLGEMEKDCLVGHGAALLLKERLLDESDRTVVPVCNACGLVAVYDKFRDYSYCSVDGENVDITFVEMSYAFKLFLDELKSMGIYPKLIIGEK